MRISALGIGPNSRSRASEETRLSCSSLSGNTFLFSQKKFKCIYLIRTFENLGLEQNTLNQYSKFSFPDWSNRGHLTRYLPSAKVRHGRCLAVTSTRFKVNIQAITMLLPLRLVLLPRSSASFSPSFKTKERKGKEQVSPVPP